METAGVTKAILPIRDQEGSPHPGSFALAILGLGANLGIDPASTLRNAVDVLSHTPGVLETRGASLYGSAPVDAPGPHYTNTAVVLKTTLSPLLLLDKMQAIEQAFGRQRNLPTMRNAPRTLDIDLLWYDGIAIQTPRLVLPHPRMHLRAFVLMPLQELLGADFAIRGDSVSEWLKGCTAQTCLRLDTTD